MWINPPPHSQTFSAQYTEPATALGKLSVIVQSLVAALYSRSSAGLIGFAAMQAITMRIVAAGAAMRHLADALAARTLRERRSPAPGGTRRKAPPAPKGPAPAGPPAEGVIPKIPHYRLPGTFGWLLPILPGLATTSGTQLRALLKHPEMAALLAGSARVVRALRPLCWMLRVKIPAPYLPPPKPRKARKMCKARKARAPREARPQARSQPLSQAPSQPSPAPGFSRHRLEDLDPWDFLHFAKRPRLPKFPLPVPKPAKTRRRGSG